jgi:hypothetical protein
LKPTDAGGEAAPTINRFAQVCGFPPDKGRVAALADFQIRLRSLSLDARKLFAHIADLAMRSHAAARKPNSAYLPELHETCGLDVDTMYRFLSELSEAAFVHLEGEYPFQNVLLAPDVKTGWLVIADLHRFCALEKISLRDVIVDANSAILR